MNRVSKKSFDSIVNNPCSFPGLKELHHWPCDMQLWNLPAFAKSSHWFVLGDERPVSGRRQLVRKIMHWNDDESEDEILFEIQESILEPEEWDQQFDTLIGIPIIPYVREPYWGFDGESFGVQASRSSVRYQWWCEGEKENREFIEAVGQIRDWLDAKIEENKL